MVRVEVGGRRHVVGAQEGDEGGQNSERGKDVQVPEGAVQAVAGRLALDPPQEGHPWEQQEGGDDCVRKEEGDKEVEGSPPAAIVGDGSGREHGAHLLWSPLSLISAVYD